MKRLLILLILALAVPLTIGLPAIAQDEAECVPCPGTEDNPCSENSFTGWVELYPSETELCPGDQFYVDVDWYRTCFCPSDYFKVFIRNDATGETWEIGRHAEPYWTMCPSYCTESYRQYLTAPSTAGIYTVRFVHAAGHGYGACYYPVCWDGLRSDGGFIGHAPEEMTWDLNEIAKEFTITVYGECVDCLVEKEIKERWEAECPSCDEARNHGKYVSCRAKIVSEYVEMGLVDEEGSSCLINPEARTDCGKKK